MSIRPHGGTAQPDLIRPSTACTLRHLVAELLGAAADVLRDVLGVLCQVRRVDVILDGVAERLRS